MSWRCVRSIGVVIATWAGAVIALWVTRPDLAGSPASWPADHVARVACWLLAAAWTAWLTATGSAIALALADRGLGTVRGALRWAPPIAGHALRAALAGSLAVAPPAPPVTVHVGTDGRLTPGTRPLPTTTTTTPRSPGPRPAAPGSPQPIRATPIWYHVRPGDNLWTIARAELARRVGREPDDRDIAPYWLRVIAANRATLRSGDPNLIYPGEIVELPNP
jgi:nucleoid-associated protein YgaU